MYNTQIIIVMKKLVLLTGLILALGSFKPVNAQVSLSINIGSQPNWGPRGYDYVEYYYMPEINTYYYVPTKRFIYLEGGHWVHRKSLPQRYHAYNLYNGRKVVINEPKPYLRQVRYIDNRYYKKDNRNHPGLHKHGPHKHEKGRGYRD